MCVWVCVFFTISSPTLYCLIYHLISYVNIATACLLIYVATEIFETSSRAARVITRWEPRRAAPLLCANPETPRELIARDWRPPSLFYVAIKLLAL